MTVPAQPKLYHIAHVDRLTSIVADQWIWCDREVVRRAPPGTTIGMSDNKSAAGSRSWLLSSHPDLHVGDCMPFYFCPRSVMLYLVYRAITRGFLTGVARVHRSFEADLIETVEWADAQRRRLPFTLSNAGALLFRGSLRP